MDGLIRGIHPQMAQMNADMKEYGLLLSPAMVCARAELRKTQTRRLMTPYNTVYPSKSWDRLELWEAFRWDATAVQSDGTLAVLMPDGLSVDRLTTIILRPRIQPGDKIWWKETHKVMNTDSLYAYPELQDGRPIDPGDPNEEEFPMRVPIYRATDPNIELVVEDENGDDKAVGWSPSTLMPRKWARFVDEVVSVRAERIQDISAADAIAEGISQRSKDDGRTWKYGIVDRDGQPGTDDHGWPWHEWCLDPVQAYRKLFTDINGPEAWERNELVWVYDWKKP